MGKKVIDRWDTLNIEKKRNAMLEYMLIGVNDLATIRTAYNRDISKLLEGDFNNNASLEHQNTMNVFRNGGLLFRNVHKNVFQDGGDLQGISPLMAQQKMSYNILPSSDTFREKQNEHRPLWLAPILYEKVLLEELKELKDRFSNYFDRHLHAVDSEMSPLSYDGRKLHYISEDVEPIWDEENRSKDSYYHSRNDSIFFKNRDLEIFTGFKRSDFEKPNVSYIGGSDEEAREKFIKSHDLVYSKMRDYESKYGLPNNMLINNVSIEGFIDEAIKDLNALYRSSKENPIYVRKEGGHKNLGEFKFGDSIDLFEYFGYDFIGSDLEYNKIKPYLQEEIENVMTYDRDNELETAAPGVVESDESLSAIDKTMHLISAKLKLLEDLVVKDAKKLGITLDDRKKLYWINQYWNQGERRGANTFKKNKGSYLSPAFKKGKVTWYTNGRKFLRNYDHMNKYLKNKK